MPSLKIQRENVTTSQMSQREQGTSGIEHKAIDKVRACRVPPGVMDMTISTHARPFLNQGTRMRLALFVHLALSFPNELEAFTISSHNKPSLASFSRRHFQGPTFTAPTPPGQTSHHLFISHLVYLLLPSYEPSPKDMEVGDVGETKKKEKPPLSAFCQSLRGLR